MNITQLKRLSLPVSNQENVLDEDPGFELLQDHPVPMSENTRWLELTPKGAATSLVLVSWIPNTSPGSIDGIMLETKDIAAACTQLQQAGVAVDGPFETPLGRQATFTDPDGNSFVLCETLRNG